MKKKWMLDQTVRHAIEETWAFFTNPTDTPNPALFLARLADLARSNAFLWTQAGLQVQEWTTRMVPVGQSLSRSLVLATVAADIFVGYTSLRERARWLPSLVRPRDWQLQHQRSANRVFETAASLVEALRKMVQSLTSGDFEGVTRALAEAGLQLDGEADITSLLQLVGVLLGNSQAGETDETAGDADAVEVGMQVGKSIGSIPTDLLLVGRTLGLLDGVTRQLDPKMDTMEIIAHYT